MKLSEMNTQQLAEALCRITPAVSRIVEDPATLEALRSFPEKGTMPQGVANIKAVSLIAPVLLGAHLHDIAEVLAALTGKSAVQILQQKGHETIKDITACLDKDLIDFFMPPADMAPTES